MKEPFPPLAQAKAKALRLLEIRPRSEWEIRQRLTQADFAQDVTEEVIALLREKKFLDDERFARFFLEQKLHSKPMGARALRQELQAKGIDRSIIDGVVQELTLETDQHEMAKQLAFTRVHQLKSVPIDTAKRRLSGFLSRRGFSSDIVYSVVKEVLEEKHDDF